MAFRKFQLSLDAIDLSWILLIFTLAVIPRKHSGIFTFFIIILAFLTGATNENIGPIFIILTYFYYASSSNSEFRQCTYPSTFSCIAGFIILITHNTGEAASEKGRAFQIRLIIEQLVQYDGILLTIALSLILILSIQNHFRRIDLNNDILIAELLTASALASVGALILSPQIPPRTYFGSVILLITACLVGLNRLVQLTKITWIIPIGCACAISGVAFQRYVDVYPPLVSNYERFYTAEQAALNAQKYHRNDIYVPGPAITVHIMKRHILKLETKLICFGKIHGWRNTMA
ncbi:DUF6056 family protein [Ligilactobacillus aviarius]|uniref:DUF6056 family protein n=1 Tax=Ligilactobacillus aviarius TaxID=1606 RepID=UPI0012DA450E|nr:DUF6056 family protein [Ligilactobacillus aviarius]